MSNKRPKFFAQKYIRLLTKTAAAQDLGPSTCWMLAVIVSQEDAKRYTEPAKYYFGQLMPLCGFNSKKQLRAAIVKAVEHGWLDYRAGGKGYPGRFSATIPREFQSIEPTACDEISGSDMEPQTEPETICSSDSEPEAEPQVHRKCTAKGTLLYLPLSPTPISSSNDDNVRVDRPSRSKKEATRDYPQDFEQWWAVYPRKVGKPSALKAFGPAIKRIRSEHKLSQADALGWLVERTRTYADSVDDFRAEHIKHPGPWLNDDRFNDQPSSQAVEDDDPYAGVPVDGRGGAA